MCLSKFWANTTLRTDCGSISRGKGQQYEYTHDDTCPVRYDQFPRLLCLLQPGEYVVSSTIWYAISRGKSNRTQTQVGGDQNGGSLRAATYSPNTLNQYTSRTVPGAVDIMGLVPPAATHSVNGQAAYHHNEYFQKALTVNNNGTVVWQGVTNVAVLGNESITNKGYLLVPPANQTFQYGIWTVPVNQGCLWGVFYPRYPDRPAEAGSWMRRSQRASYVGFRIASNGCCWKGI